MSRAIRMLCLVAVAGLILAACGESTGEPDENGRITVIMTESKFEPANIKVVPGQTVTFVLVNEGEKEHEFMIGRDVNTDDGFPNGFHTNWLDTLEPMPMVMPAEAAVGGESMDMGGDEGMDMGEEGEHAHEEEDMHMDHGFMVVRDPGQTAEMTIVIPSDAGGQEWEIGCFTDDGAHYDEGMKGKLIIEG